MHETSVIFSLVGMKGDMAMTCVHLERHADWLRRDGAWVLRSMPSAASGMQDVVFSHGPLLEEARLWWKASPSEVELWTEAGENGARCKLCGTVLCWPRREGQAQSREALLARLDGSLRTIVDAELAAGNEIVECELGWGNPRAVLVLFRYPFTERYEALPDGVTYREVNDPHWWKEEYLHGETLGCVACRF